MEEKQSRVRWDSQELSRLAAVMVPRLLADPELHPLEAVRAAQACLEPERRRELKAWSLVEGRLQPKLDEAMARLRALPLQPAADQAPVRADNSTAPVADACDDAGGAITEVPAASATEEGAQPQGSQEAAAEPVQTGNPAPVGEASGKAGDAGAEAPVASEAGEPRDCEGAAAEPDAVAPPGKSLGLFDDQAALPTAPSIQRLAGPSRAERPVAPSVLTPDPAALEAALLAALRSPAVEEALVELFSRTMAKALLRTGTGETRPLPVHPTKSQAQRVLLAGFPEIQQQALIDALGESFDVRTWKPVNGPQLFQTLARLCRLVVFPEDADEEADAGLKDMDVRMIRHAGNAGRLIERIGELG